jgi:dephospho-CoA kinase
VRLIGLTGGIASGKSTVARLLADRGAVVIDLDEIAREVVEPGHQAHAEIIERFGDEVTGPDGSIDRKKLASIVFNDLDALASLNAITHPAVGREMWGRLESLRGTDSVVVIDVPLLVEAGMTTGFDAILVVTAPEPEQIERLKRDRGMEEEEARARIAAQTTEEARRAVATHVIENVGSSEELEKRVDAFWREFTA